jgi:hypothetical protein
MRLSQFEIEGVWCVPLRGFKRPDPKVFTGIQGIKKDRAKKGQALGFKPNDLSPDLSLPSPSSLLNEV